MTPRHLNNLPGFDLADLLEMLDDEKLIIRLMEIFYLDSANIQAELEQKLSQGDLEAAKIMLHNVKGAAGAVGATELLKVTLVLEKNITQGQPYSSANESFATILHQTRETIQSLLARS